MYGQRGIKDSRKDYPQNAFKRAFDREVRIGLLEFVEDGGQFLFLPLDGRGVVGKAMWPVDTADGGEPYSAYLVFWRLCLHVDSKGKQQEKMKNLSQNDVFFLNLLQSY